MAFAPSIFILATGKTGSTLVFYSLKESAEAAYGNYAHIFEPRTAADVAAGFSPPCIAKMLFERFHKCAETGFTELFHKRLSIIRDPRDTILSRLLYQAQDLFEEERAADVDRIVTLLRAKEADPSCIGVRDLYGRIADIMQFPFSPEVAARASVSVINMEQAQDFFLVRYEDIVIGDWAGVERYVEFPVQSSDVDRTRHKRVRRSATYGDWRRWFTPSDIDYFRPLLSASLQKAGYGDDWELERHPVIDPASGSDFVRKLYDLQLSKRKRKHATSRSSAR